MQTTSATWKQLWAAGAPLEARAMIGGTEILLAAAPVINRAAMQDRLSVGNVASASLALAARTSAAIPRSAEVVIEARLNDGATASEWLPMGTFYISRRSRDPVTGVTALECYDALLKANAVWTPSAGAWPRTMAAVLAELLKLLGMTLDSRTVIPSGLSFVIGQPEEGATIRDVLGTIAQAGGGNWIVTPEGKLRLLPLVDSAGAGEATEDVLDVAGVVGGMGVVPAGTITGIRCAADGSATLIGDDTGIVVDMSLAPLTAADMADMLIGQRYQAYTLTGAVCDPAAELGDYVRAGANGEVASVLYGAQIALGRACRGDIAAPEAGEVTDEYPYIGGSAKTLALAKAYVNQAVDALDGELSQQEIFNRLTDNGAAQGLVMLNNQLYINASYINAGRLNVSYINFNDPGAHYDVPNENDASTLLDGQSVSGGWIVNTSGSGFIRLIQCDYAVPLRGMTVSVTFTYDTWRDGSQTMDNDGEDCYTYINSNAYEVQVNSGWFHIPATNPFTHQFTVPDNANTFWIRVNCTGVKAISVSLSGTVAPSDDINFTYAGLQIGDFLLDRDGNIITEGASIFNAASFRKVSTSELKMSTPLPVASGGTGAKTAAGARANLGLTETEYAFRNYNLNGCNIDSTDGNWTVAISEAGYGTYPQNPWVQVTQFDATHFIFQIACGVYSTNNATSTNYLYFRQKYKWGSWSDWSTIMDGGVVPIISGGTGAATAAGARANLGVGSSSASIYFNPTVNIELFRTSQNNTYIFTENGWYRLLVNAGGANNGITVKLNDKTIIYIENSREQPIIPIASGVILSAVFNGNPANSFLAVFKMS